MAGRCLGSTCYLSYGLFFHELCLDQDYYGLSYLQI